MKINLNKVKQIPKEVSDKFGVCVYGEPDAQIKQWISVHEFETEKVGPYTNIYIYKDLEDVFEQTEPFTYIDGFSPNLNKHLHLGHMANLVLAKAFVGMDVAKETIAILGDTLTGEVSKDEALEKFSWYCDKFSYKVDKMFFASEMCGVDEWLDDGAGQYEGTKVFNVGNEDTPVVGKKSDGSTTYFYQDVALANKLKASTLYLTGHEQNQHFAMLKTMFPSVHHLGLGLVKANQVKMSSRLNNVIMAQDLIDILLGMFDNDYKVIYNVIAGHILKAAPKSDKNIDVMSLNNPLNSQGLYLSYTLAKMKSAGVEIMENKEFTSKKLQFKMMKAKQSLAPNVLFEELVEHAKYMSVLYENHKIKDNEDNKKMFGVLASDLALGLKKLGMFEVDRV